MTIDIQKKWEEYTAHTISEFTPSLAKLGYELDIEQPHIIGERSLTRPIKSGSKLVLIGKRKSEKSKVIIKIGTDEGGIHEIEQERERRIALALLPFAYDVFRMPRELLFTKSQSGVIAITEYIEQEIPFIKRPLKKQFSIALDAFKAQENINASTYEHHKLIHDTFEEMDAKEYSHTAEQYVDGIKQTLSQKDSHAEHFTNTLDNALDFINTHQKTIEQYCNFLTHWDFTPQNFRIRDDTLYILDNASFRFGNKYEGWARFINFMVLYNPSLAEALITYVKLNRAPEELMSLKLMRIYRLIELVRYYVNWLQKTNGNLHLLAIARITFWINVLENVLNNTDVPTEIIEEYKKTRDTLRSTDEKRRQQTLH
ncbi:hypothetical protein MNBD_CPR01-307 [hydrothermal vent metagenome]|uniref:Aminoglycoside phosphotransferase domain-containing protein n=1 Tax=hydrothermal vent metagenome TaxID=652676 RepID=A0A3B0UYJ0_9ZZZZ